MQSNLCNRNALFSARVHATQKPPHFVINGIASQHYDVIKSRSELITAWHAIMLLCQSSSDVMTSLCYLVTSCYIVTSHYHATSSHQHGTALPSSYHCITMLPYDVITASTLFLVTSCHRITTLPYVITSRCFDITLWHHHVTGWPCHNIVSWRYHVTSWHHYIMASSWHHDIPFWGYHITYIITT